MAYKLKLQLRDTSRNFTTVTARNTAYDKVLAGLISLGVPEKNILLYKIETQYSTFLGKEVEKVTEKHEDSSEASIP